MSIATAVSSMYGTVYQTLLAVQSTLTSCQYYQLQREGGGGNQRGEIEYMTQYIYNIYIWVLH